MKASELLRLAREILAARPVEYTWTGICHALHVAREENAQRRPSDAHEKAWGRIRELLGEHAYLQNWLMAKSTSTA